MNTITYKEWEEKTKGTDAQLYFRDVDKYYESIDEYMSDYGYKHKIGSTIEAEECLIQYPKNRLSSDDLVEAVLDQVDSEMKCDECSFHDYVEDKEELKTFLDKWLKKQTYNLFYPHGNKVIIPKEMNQYWYEE